MITYKNSLFGFSLIFHVHGSALWQAMVPALLSTLVLLIIVYTTEAPIENSVDSRLTDHVYTIGAYIAFFSFLLTFRLNFAYQRYWEGATALHQMLSKWLDVATLMSAFHYQSRQYDSYRPPAFGHHNKLRNVTRERDDGRRNSGATDGRIGGKRTAGLKIQTVVEKILFATKEP